MKKFVSAAMVAIGVISLAIMVYAVGHFGVCNMRRVNQQAYAWKIEHYGP